MNLARLTKLLNDGHKLPYGFFKEELTDDVYHAGPGIGSTMVKTFLDSPARYNWIYNQGHREAPNDAMVFGSALHCAVLQPDLFPKKYVSFIKAEGTGSRARNEAAKAEIEKSGQVALPLDQINTINHMVEGIRRYIGPYLDGGISESSYYWTDEETGLLCKVRLDHVFGATIFDLKSTSDISKIQSHIANFNYHVQAAFYSDAFDILKGERPNFIFLFCEKSEPYLLDAVMLDQEALQLGRDRYRESLKGIQLCQELGQWPASLASITANKEIAQIRTIGLPRWAFYKGVDG